MSAYYKVRNMH